MTSGGSSCKSNITMLNRQYQHRILLLLLVVTLCMISYGVIRKDQMLHSFNDSSLHNHCDGHYYLCRFRDMVKSKWLYDGHIKLYDNVYDLSSMSEFKTNYFRTKPEKIARYKDLAMAIRNFKKIEWKENWFTQNLNYMKVNLSNVPFCSFQGGNYFKYIVEYAGSNFSNWPLQMKLNITEKIMSQLPIPTKYSDITGTVFTANSRVACVVQSYVEKTTVLNEYLMECPLIESNFKVVIQASYNTGTNYWYNCNNSDSGISTVQTLTASNLKSLSFKFHKVIPAMPRCSSAITQHAPGFWIKMKGMWHWSNYRCYFPLSFDSELRACLKKTHVIAFGDSHMRKRLRAIQKYPSIIGTLIHITVTSHLVHQLQKHIPAMLATPDPKVVIMNSGHWGLRHLDPASYISEMTQVFNITRTLARPPNNLKIIWIQSSALPYKSQYHYRWKENNLIAAMNEWVDWNMGKIAVPVVKAYDISIAMNSETSDNSHYRDLLGKDAIREKDLVSVGGAIDSVLFNLIYNKVNCA